MSTRQERRRLADEYQQVGKQYIKHQYEDDRTPFVKKVDIIGKLLALLLTVVFFMNITVLVHGGGYDYSKIVPVLGIGSYRVDDSMLKNEIKDGSLLYIGMKDAVHEGDVIVYGKEKNYSVGVIEKYNNDKCHIVSNDLSKNQTVLAKDIVGPVVGKTSVFAGIIAFFTTSIGELLLGIIVVLCLSLPDILMFKRRKEKADIEKAKIAKKKEEQKKLALEKGEPVEPDNKPKAQKKIEEKKVQKKEKIKNDSENISKEMKDLRRKMAEEEAELDRKMKRKR